MNTLLLILSIGIAVLCVLLLGALVLLWALKKFLKSLFAGLLGGLNELAKVKL